MGYEVLAIVVLPLYFAVMTVWGLSRKNAYGSVPAYLRSWSPRR